MAARARPDRPPSATLLRQRRGGRSRAPRRIPGALPGAGAPLDGAFRQRQVDPAGRAIGAAAARSGRRENSGRRPVADERSSRERFRLRHFGFVFQGFNLFPSLTAREQLEMVVRWGEGAPASRGPSPRRRDARPARARAPRPRAGRPAFRRRETARGRGPSLAQAAAVLLRRRADRLARLGSRRAGHPSFLRSAGHDRGAVLFLVGHDPRLVPYADRVLHLVDGRLSDEPPPAHLEPHS